MSTMRKSNERSSKFNANQWNVTVTANEKAAKFDQSEEGV